MLITEGRTTIEDKNKKIPQRKSIQLPKSFSNPRKDFTIKIIPNGIKNVSESFVPAPNRRINPTTISIAPKILTNMFFKPKNPLKINASVAQPG